MTTQNTAHEQLALRCASAGYDPCKALENAMNELQPTEVECVVMLLALLQMRAERAESGAPLRASQTSVRYTRVTSG